MKNELARQPRFPEARPLCLSRFTLFSYSSLIPLNAVQLFLFSKFPFSSWNNALMRGELLDNHRRILAAEKLEIWTSREENASVTTEFSYLGYITLSDNASTMYKSRELKSVALPETEAISLKLRLHKPHNNAHNVYQQV